MFESLVPLLYRVSTRLRMSPRGFLRLSAGTSSNDALESSEGSAQKLRQLLTASLCRVPLSRYSEVRDVGLIWTLRELCGEFVRLLSPLNRVVDSRKQFYNVLYIYIHIYIYVYIYMFVSCTPSFSVIALALRHGMQDPQHRTQHKTISEMICLDLLKSWNHLQLLSLGCSRFPHLSHTATLDSCRLPGAAVCAFTS